MAGVTWTDEEIIKLIQIWGEEEIQAQLEGCTRNMHVYEKIARELRDMGYDRTAIQCQEKIKKLKGEYKKIKDNNDETGRKRKNWRFYEAVNEVLGCKPATCPPVVIDSMAVEKDDGKEHNERFDEAGRASSISSSSSSHADSECTVIGDESTCTAGNTGVMLTDTDNDKISAIKPKIEKRKGKKRSREDKFDKALNAVDKMMVTLKENDALLLNLEEKRMNLDEKLLEMKERRLREDKEREERMRREFQLKIFSLLHQGAPIPHPFYANQWNNNGNYDN